jgi:hypothetical protein
MTDEDVRAIFRSSFTASRYFTFEKTLRKGRIGSLKRVDFIVFFCREYLGYGRRKMALKTQLSQYQIAESYKNLSLPSGRLPKVKNTAEI